jgi:hypothetical protein
MGFVHKVIRTYYASSKYFTLHANTKGKPTNIKLYIIIYRPQNAKTKQLWIEKSYEQTKMHL